LDGAHNEGGFETLEAALEEEFPTTRWVLVLGVMGDKNLEGMIGRIAGRVDAIITTTVPEERALPAAEIASRVAPLVTVPVEAIGDPETALAVARQRAGADGSVLVTGSIYLVGVVRQAALSDGSR
jgi:dihydrofolate synthase / folylpolyglutamate synthase